jgi:hypothetical protein
LRPPLRSLRFKKKTTSKTPKPHVRHQNPLDYHRRNPHTRNTRWRESINYGPGYRVYFVEREGTLIVLLAGGDKRTQERDIKTALELAQKL